MLGLFAATAVPAGNLSVRENLFFIKRSKNANEVHYDARVKNCHWRHPAVDSYWRDIADGPYDVEEIKWFEDPAYGFRVERASDSEITIRLKALPERAIRARLSPTEGGGCSVAVRTEIGGNEAELRSVYVDATESFFGIPRVHYIDILGFADDGKRIWQRLPQTKRGRSMEDARPSDSLWETGAPTWGRPL